MMTASQPLELRASGVAIFRAATFAAEKHVMQRRKGAIAEPYINHLLEVAELLVRTQPGFDITLVIAGLLHDTLEDTETTREELAHGFGDDIAALVAEVSDDKTLKPEVRQALQIEGAPNRSVRAQNLSAADKVATMRSILVSPPVGWSLQRKRDYFGWAKRVVDLFTHLTPALREEFDSMFAKFGDFEKLARRGQQETRVIDQQFIRLQDVPVVVETWTYSDMRGRTAVFLSESIYGWTDSKLKMLLIRSGYPVDSQCTICRAAEFTTVRFAFE
jgi:hypothetical protein